MAADGEQLEDAGAASDSRPQEQTFSGSHTTVTITTFESQFSRLGFATWKCSECGIWRVPGPHRRLRCALCTRMPPRAAQSFFLWFTRLLMRSPPWSTHDCVHRRTVLSVGRKGGLPRHVCAERHEPSMLQLRATTRTGTRVAGGENPVDSGALHAAPSCAHLIVAVWCSSSGGRGASNCIGEASALKKVLPSS